MGKEIIGWATLALGLALSALLIAELAVQIRKRKNVKLNVTALVFLTVSVLGYVVCRFVELAPPLLSLLWIAFFWVYMVLMVVRMVRHHRRSVAARRQVAATSAQPSDSSDKQPPASD